MHDINKISSYTQSLTLLYVEDDKENQSFILELLGNFFKHVIVATDGQDGLEKFKRTPIDLVITDINMPRLNGLEMIEEIRNIDKEVPIIILSAHIEPHFFTQSIKMRVKGYLI